MSLEPPHLGSNTRISAGEQMAARRQRADNEAVRSPDLVIPPAPKPAEVEANPPRAPRSFQLLAIAASALLLAATILVVLDRRHEAQEAQYRTRSAELGMLSQRIAVYSPRAAAGDAQAFEVLYASGQRFAAALAALGAVESDSVAQAAALQTLRTRWVGAQAHLQAVLAQRQSLIASAARHPTPAAPAQRTEALPPAVAQAGAAALALVGAAEPLFEGAARLVAPQPQRAPSRYLLAALVAAGLAFVCLLWIGKVVLDDAERRAADNLHNAVRDRHANQRTQHAILRLLDEISTLAHGDLTVRASVNDETTGAIADAVNYAVGELRRLVAGINTAATRLAEACTQAQAIAGELLSAAQRQSQEIAVTSAAVTAVATSVMAVSERAEESARVADAALAAATEGSGSVRRSVAGMESIREQMQQTAKRVKRLGESSQEIGEIVDLISDITRRTDVLAVNAAIQANAGSGGGRGFGAVAEEVQRLAARSAQAAQQISAVVRTIQADTQDATSAMERSTERVVEQTGLAYAAGDALARIERVSRELARLIAAISSATREQRDAAERIHTAMRDILRITELTTESTHRSADRSAQLAALARELKQSVAGFKVS